MFRSAFGKAGSSLATVAKALVEGRRQLLCGLDFPGVDVGVCRDFSYRHLFHILSLSYSPFLGDYYPNSENIVSFP